MLKDCLISAWVDMSVSCIAVANHCCLMLLQAQQLPPQLASSRISYKDFKAMAALRSSIYALSFALDFCTQVRRHLALHRVQSTAALMCSLVSIR
jgi:hypothetical protein